MEQEELKKEQILRLAKFIHDEYLFAIFRTPIEENRINDSMDKDTIFVRPGFGGVPTRPTTHSEGKLLENRDKIDTITTLKQRLCELRVILMIRGLYY